MCEIGCMRVIIIRSCNSCVSKSIVRTAPEKLWSPKSAAKGSNRLRASTISLTKFINLSSKSKLTFTGWATSWGVSMPNSCAAIGGAGVALWLAIVAGSWGGGTGLAASKICFTASLAGSIGRGVASPASLDFFSANATPLARLSKSSMSWLLSPDGSVLVASMPATISLTASRVSSSKLVFCVSSSRLPSRIFPSKVSPAWVTFSNLLKAKNPLLPFSVWMALKMLPTNFLSSGVFSSNTKSRSSWSRISLASMMNSTRISSVLSIRVFVQFCLFLKFKFSNCAIKFNGNFGQIRRGLLGVRSPLRRALGCVRH